MNSTSDQKKILFYGLFLSAGAFIAFFFSMSSPSDPKNAFIFGYSLERILVGVGLLSVGITLLSLTLMLVRNPEKSHSLWNFVFQRRDTSYKTFIFSLILFLTIWIVFLLPPYRLGALNSYVSRISPILIWLILVSFLSILVCLFERDKNKSFLFFEENKYVLKVGILVFCILGIFATFIVVTGIGTSYPADYWYGAGVPILGLQVLFSIIIGVAFIFLEPKIKFGGPYLDIALFISLWVITAVFWARQPISANYFMPDTADNPIYPYSDGATYDQGAQYALIGQGIFNSNYFDNTLYSVLLAYFHLLLGQNFQLLMALQAVLYAIFPAILYLIGKELHSRTLGISVGILIALRGINAVIAAKWIDTASPKMMLTDFPAAIGVAIFTWVLLRYLRQPEKFSGLIWTGATFGLTLMIRTHVLTLLPVAIVFIALSLKLSWKNTVLAGFMVILGLFTVTLPWEIRNQSKGIPMFYVYYYRIEVILIHRYGLDLGAVAPLQEVQPNNSDLKLIGRLRFDKRDSDEDLLCDSKFCSIINHFSHNIVTSFVSLPSSPFFDDLWNTVKADTPFWKKTWNDGQVGVLGTLMIISNMALVSIGFGTIWQQSQTRTLLPILIFLAYLATNSLGFTSGGRYIVPVDWIIYVFFAAGGVQLFVWFLNAKIPLTDIEAKPSFFEKIEYSKLVFVILPILLLGTFIPISDALVKPRYQLRTNDEILNVIEAKGLVEKTGYSREELADFLSQPDAIIHEGRALYPRYYPSGDGEQDQTTHYRYLDYQRLVFTLIGPYSENIEGVIIPGLRPSFSMHAEDVVVLGCQNTAYKAPFIDAVVVFVTSGDGYVYTRSPGAPLECPLPEPKQ